jgi:hypothetical protein
MPKQFHTALILPTSAGWTDTWAQFKNEFGCLNDAGAPVYEFTYLQDVSDIKYEVQPNFPPPPTPQTVGQHSAT